uniref:Transposase MuDR plant domain-containing protein n=1 Tax=Lactuca sativa TaxID=4236 RepID=A0A9R1UX61_LACSA|nr:hypothetical protein LSAT_V11C700345460 [Lactuca sativa]
MDSNFTIEVNHTCYFVPKPIVYFNPVKMVVSNVDFRSMSFMEFISYVKNLVKDGTINVYYCLPQRSLRDWLRVLEDENDYVRFLDAGYENGGMINLYIDHSQYPVMEWTEEEIAEDGSIDGNTDNDDDVDSNLSDDEFVEYELDDEVIQLQPSDDPFIRRNFFKPSRVVDDEKDDKKDVKKDLHKYPIHDPNQKWDTMFPVLGMKLCDRYELKHLLSNYVVANGYKLWYEKNDSTRLLVRCCKGEEKSKCPFKLLATWMSKERSFHIKSLISEHNCSRAFNLGSMVTYSWIGKQLIETIIDNPRISYRKMAATVLRDFNLKVSFGQCRNAKKFAMDEIEGSFMAHYEKLRSYGLELLRTNPGSTVKLDVDIMPDSTGLCRGEVLSAVGRDANNQMYPLAWAVVPVENKANWKGFLDLLLEDIDMGQGRGLTIISDQHKGLIEAVKERVSKCEHRQCARHVYASIKKKFSGAEYKKLFWENSGSDVIENGVSESFNAAIVEARKKPIITMLEDIRVYVMERMFTHKRKGLKWNLKICPSIRRKIEDMKKIQRSWQLTEEEVGGDSEKEVGGDSEDDLEVEVEQVVDEEVLNPGKQHVVAQTLKRRMCGPSHRNRKLRLRRKVVTKDDTGGSLENPLTL